MIPVQSPRKSTDPIAAEQQIIYAKELRAAAPASTKAAETATLSAEYDTVDAALKRAAQSLDRLSADITALGSLIDPVLRPPPETDPSAGNASDRLFNACELARAIESLNDLILRASDRITDFTQRVNLH